jgi:hypothetical protein
MQLKDKTYRSADEVMADASADLERLAAIAASTRWRGVTASPLIFDG